MKFMSIRNNHRNYPNTQYGNAAILNMLQASKKLPKSINACIFIAVLCSSMLGAQLFGQSLNKIGLLPLEIILLFKSRRGMKVRLSRPRKILLFMYIAWGVASLSGIIYAIITNHNELFDRNIAQIFQIVLIYVPMALLIWNYSKKKELLESFIKSLLIVAKIQACWAIAQLILYYTIHFDLNNYVFNVMLGGVLGDGSEWTKYSNLANSAGGILIRVSGLNRDTAFLGIVLISAFIFETISAWRLVYIFTVLISFSRSAMLTLVFMIGFETVRYIAGNKKKHTLNTNKILAYGITILAAFPLFILLVRRVDFIGTSFKRMFERLATISSGADGTNRHMGYFKGAFEVWLFKAPFYTKFFGVGVTTGGTLLSAYSNSITSLLGGISQSIWAIESDPPNFILGAGIIGFCVYYLFCISSLKYHKKDPRLIILILAIMFYGLMYNIAVATFSQLLFVFVLTDKKNSSISRGKVKELR